MRVAMSLNEIVMGEKGGDTYVLTNRDKYMGSYEWMKDDAVEDFREILKEIGATAAWVIPSSKHELLLTPMKTTKEAVEEMHREVQDTAVEENDRLSNNVWFVDMTGLHMEV